MHSTPSEVIATQVRKRRRQLDLNRQQLAEKCASIGAPQLTTAALTNIETGRPDKDGKRRREVTVEELLALACALSIHPVDLMVPADLADDAPYEVTSAIATTAATARGWISGTAFLVPPETPMDFAVAIQAMPKERAQAVSRDWFTPERQQEWNRAALEYDRQQQEGRGDS
ncbi:helix-turn-helix transcriptional regulator [Streptomyces sp. NPDC096040]|uniref:helix-turn-helix domain-containing protein n=1 Tax=Streptomyces sp. NPDC096040 TaxID=3155541 RepID=UPI0033263FB3